MFCNNCYARRYMNSFCDTYLSLHGPLLCHVSSFLYLSVINVTPIIRVLLIETQSLVMLICIVKNKLRKETGMFHALHKRKRTF